MNYETTYRPDIRKRDASALKVEARRFDQRGLAGVFGCDITAVASKTFHVNCLNAANTPLYSGTAFPTGTIFKSNGTLPAGALPLYIAP
jgi:hypothetical protein